MKPLAVLLTLSGLWWAGTSAAWAFEPSLSDRPAEIGDTVIGTVSGNPVVPFNSNLLSPGILRSSFTETARWIVSEDFDGDNRDEAAILFENGTLEFLDLERDNLRSKSSVRGLSPEAPPVVIREFGGEPYQGVLAVDTRGALLLLQIEGTRVRKLADGVSTLTSPVVGDLDGDGSSEIAAVNEEGRLLLLMGERRTQTDSTIELLPDTRLTLDDTDSDRVPEILAFSRPSSDFSFGRMGDDVEATGMAAFAWNGKFLKAIDEYALPEGEAFECLVPIIALVEDGAKRILATVSVEKEGSRLVAMSLTRGKFRENKRGPLTEDKSLLLAVGAAVLGDVGRTVVVAVSSPDSNGTLEAFRPDLTANRPQLERRISVLKNEVRSAGMALIGDFDADRQTELLAPSEDRKALRLFKFETNSIRGKDVFAGGKAVTSNLCLGDYDGDGRLDVMAGLEDGGVVILSGR